jgi:acid stress-induced BolA-like protein IbaG/YrbA
MNPEKIKSMIEAGIPGAEVQVSDNRGTGDHFSAVVISTAFEGLSLVEQHQMVYQSLKEHLTREIHALQLKTMTKNI